MHDVRPVARPEWFPIDSRGLWQLKRALRVVVKHPSARRIVTCIVMMLGVSLGHSEKYSLAKLFSGQLPPARFSTVGWCPSFAAVHRSCSNNLGGGGGMSCQCRSHRLGYSGVYTSIGLNPVVLSSNDRPCVLLLTLGGSRFIGWSQLNLPVEPFKL